MSGQDLIWERPETLRERARWYRAFAATHGNAEWALVLAAHLERQANDVEALQSRAAQLRKHQKPDPK